MKTALALLGFLLVTAASLGVVRPTSASALPIRGGVVGTFSAPSPSCPPATCSGVDMNTLTWGIPSPPSTTPSSLSFSGREFQTDLDESQFDTSGIAGEVTFVNGITQTGTSISSLLLSLEILYFDGSVDQVSRSVSILNTLNTADPIESADAVSVQQGPDFFVLEEQRATATLVISFSRASGLAAAGFASPSADPTLAELLDVEIQGFGSVIEGPGFLATIPLPGTAVLIGFGALVVLGLEAAARCHRQPRNRA